MSDVIANNDTYGVKQGKVVLALKVLIYLFVYGTFELMPPNEWTHAIRVRMVVEELEVTCHTIVKPLSCTRVSNNLNKLVKSILKEIPSLTKLV